MLWLGFVVRRIATVAGCEIKNEKLRMRLINRSLR